MQPEKGFCNKFANNLLEIERGNIGKNQNKETALNKKRRTLLSLFENLKK